MAPLMRGMIPRHRPPQSVRTTLTALARGLLRRPTADAIESRYARLWNVDHVIWIPSARFGITHAVRLCPQPIETVATSAFNCGAVFHAVAETGRLTQYVDTAPHSFLMSTSGSPVPRSAVILSEMFGQSFSREDHDRPFLQQATQRVFDMAMSVPHAARFDELRDHDVAVVSFGLGKSLYAGWGGLAVTHSAALAQRLRQQRDTAVVRSGLWANLRHDARVLARVMAHQPAVYGPLRKRRSTTDPATTFADQPFSAATAEWHRGVSPLHGMLALDNADRAAVWSEQRRRLTADYREALAEVIPDGLPTATTAACSHFCLRVPAAVRSRLRQHLWDHGVDAATLFPVPRDLCPPHRFPHATTASREVLNLPLSTQLTDAHTQRVVNSLSSSPLIERPHRRAA